MHVCAVISLMREVDAGSALPHGFTRHIYSTHGMSYGKVCRAQKNCSPSFEDNRGGRSLLVSLPQVAVPARMPHICVRSRRNGRKAVVPARGIAYD